MTVSRVVFQLLLTYNQPLVIARRIRQPAETTRQSPAYRPNVLKASRQQAPFGQVMEIAGQQSRLQRGFVEWLANALTSGKLG